MRRPVLIISKSPWWPPIRREHQLARLAAADGHRVTFVEPPEDVRSLTAHPGQWLRGFGGSAADPADRVEIVRRSAILPPHKMATTQMFETRQLMRIIGRMADQPSVAVATQPWHWPAVARSGAVRRVLDVADDWGALIPRRAEAVDALYRRAAAEADAITSVSRHLAHLFAGRDLSIIRNGADESMLSPAQSDPPGVCRLVYLGTLSERFDAELVAELLHELPEWELDLYGPCAYAGCGAEPAEALTNLLSSFAGQVRWHGALDRSRRASVLDTADILLLPNRAVSQGQDSMKIYDYSSRGRPVVATEAALAGISEPPPHLYSGSSAVALAQSIKRAVGEPESWRNDRVAWARGETWETRWTAWSEALFGVGERDRWMEATAKGALNS